MSLEKCFEERKLRKITKDLEKSKSSLETAKEKLTVAKKLAGDGYYGPSIIYAYSSMFHSARALLYKDGIQEKSHYCLIQYLKEEYGKTNKIDIYLLHIIDSFRVQRHDVMYGTKKSRYSFEECELCMKSAEKLIKEIKRLIKF